jgi:hypothetical protein
MRRVILSAVAIAASLVPLWTLDAAAQAPPIAPIGKHQFFNGLVNGSSGPAIIRMACFGPEPIGGRLGHPLAGQSTAVIQAPPTASGTIAPGFTGLADSIEATLYFPTPVVGPPGGGVHLALFDFYDEPAPISTELELPCSGSGVVVFNPVEGGKNARSADVAVSLVGQP